MKRRALTPQETVDLLEYLDKSRPRVSGEQGDRHATVSYEPGYGSGESSSPTRKRLQSLAAAYRNGLVYIKGKP